VLVSDSYQLCDRLLIQHFLGCLSSQISKGVAGLESQTMGGGGKGGLVAE